MAVESAQRSILKVRRPKQTGDITLDSHVALLPAAGTTGPELLFQATSEQMIKAYAHVPRQA